MKPFSELVALFFFVLCSTSLSAAAPSAGLASWVDHWQGGGDFGGSGDLLLSDTKANTFGLGIGQQFSVFASSRRNASSGLKVRLERLMLRENASGHSDTSDIVNETQLKALEQKWWTLGVGFEWRTWGPSSVVFWEALAGYAFATSGHLEMVPTTVDQSIIHQDPTLNSGLFLGGGIGVKRKVAKYIMAHMSARTMLFLGTLYQGDLGSRTMFALPLMFSVGFEIPLGRLTQEDSARHE